MHSDRLFTVLCCTYISDVMLGDSAVCVTGGQAGGGLQDGIFIWSLVILLLLTDKEETHMKIVANSTTSWT